jgi:hypothetical protein
MADRLAGEFDSMSWVRIADGAADELPLDRCAVVIAVRAVSEGRCLSSVIASTASWAFDVDAAQASCGEGPSILASRTGGCVFVIDVHRFGVRWPLLLATLPQSAIRAVVAFPIVSATGNTIGTLTAYSPASFAPSEETFVIGAQWADKCAVALNARGRSVVDHIAADDSDDELSVAVGVLCARHRLTSADGWALLRACAFGDGVTPYQMARRIAATPPTPI